MNEPRPGAPGGSGPSPRAPEVGELFAGRFQIEREAGSGGVGVVYRALDQTSGEPVALKVLRKRDETTLRRFAVEAASIERLRHPGIVRYLGHGVGEGGEPFLAMEWVEGENLRARLDREPLSLDESLTLGRRVADALAAAHALGVLHRDIKPSNIVLAGGSVEGAKLVDFGVARDATQAAVTQTGDFVGTVGYLAPEQARGERDLDGRADLFSMGCVLFRCLTNVDPFEGRETMTVLAKLVMHEAPRVSTLRPEVPAELDDLVAQLLEKKRDQRPASAAALSAELARLAGGVAAGTLRPASATPKRSAPPVAAEKRNLASSAPEKRNLASSAPEKRNLASSAPEKRSPAPAASEQTTQASRSRRRSLFIGLGLASLVVLGLLALLLGRH